MDRVALIILDGWGHTEEKRGNALRIARTPFLDELFARYPHVLLGTSGAHVGLPEGQMGNSEVGHMNIGAGRIIYQDFTRINRAIADGDFFTNPALVEACRVARERASQFHLMGLVSDGGVHSHLEHLLALLDLARREGVRRVVVHTLLDGRDTSPHSGLGHVQRVLEAMRQRGTGRLGVVSGRYYMMDRDKRWDRVAKAYDALVRGTGRTTEDAPATIRACYEAGETDEFLQPTVVLEGGRPAPVEDSDVFVNFNFRADRVRQITTALTDPGFSAFPARRIERLHYVCMTQYDERFRLPVAFGPSHPAQTFGELVSAFGARQLRIAETEKYAHVTYFFNGGVETVFAGEERILVPSPRVATYDLRPEMSAAEVTDRLVERARSEDFGAIICNFANCDMVGHTGKLDAAVAAVEVVDRCLARAIPALQERGLTVFLTADHGNIEQMVDYVTGEPFTEHTTNPVPLLVTDESVAFTAPIGRLADLGPTMLSYARAPVPAVMQGRILLTPRRATSAGVPRLS